MWPTSLSSWKLSSLSPGSHTLVVALSTRAALPQITLCFFSPRPICNISVSNGVVHGLSASEASSKMQISGLRAEAHRVEPVFLTI